MKSINSYRFLTPTSQAVTFIILIQNPDASEGIHKKAEKTVLKRTDQYRIFQKSIMHAGGKWILKFLAEARTQNSRDYMNTELSSLNEKGE